MPRNVNGQNTKKGMNGNKLKKIEEKLKRGK